MLFRSLYTNTGLTAAKDGDTTRAALWFAQAAATPGAEAASRETNLTRWAAWRGESTTAMRAFESGIGMIGEIAWRASQDAIIVTSWGKEAAAIWDVKNETRWQAEVKMRAAVWAREGASVVIAEENVVRLLEYPSARELARVPCEGKVRCLAASGDGSWIAVGAPAPFLWDAATGKTVPLPALADALTGLEFSRDGKRILLTSGKRRGVCSLERPENFLFEPVENLGEAAQIGRASCRERVCYPV